MEIGLAIFLTDYTIEPTRLGPLVEERGFESLPSTEHSHIPVSRETPRPGGGEWLRPSTAIAATRSSGLAMGGRGRRSA